jgi:hypothetical protein
MERQKLLLRDNVLEAKRASTGVLQFMDHTSGALSAVDELPQKSESV